MFCFAAVGAGVNDFFVSAAAEFPLDCADDPEFADSCAKWAESNECNSNPQFMMRSCRRSCKCPDAGCVDLEDAEKCGVWARDGECDSNRMFMHVRCRLSCGCPPACADAEAHAASCSAWVEAGECDSNARWMLNNCRYSCGCPRACADQADTDECTAWAASGECEKNPSYMHKKCAYTCDACTTLTYAQRCPLPNASAAAVPHGAMHETFERALSNFPGLEPQLLSRDPWVVSFDSFASDDEVDALLAHADGRYERSVASAGRNDDEFVAATTEIRTSDNTWCDNACLDDARVRAVTDRIAAVTRVPSTHFEPLQFLRYLACDHADADDCQFYRRHHDTVPEMVRMQPGPRVYTMFLYLSDVEEGGGTKFDSGFTVTPKKGRAVLWPSTFDDQPFVQDERTHHEALPVTKGVKYAANAWVHQFDFMGPYASGCTG